MATKTILEKINSLEYFDGLRAVKEILRNIFSSITILETNSVLLGEITSLNTNITSGSLTIGKRYQINFLVAGDNFTNVGYISNNISFIATGTTPTNWTNSTNVNNSEKLLRVDFNDLDLNITTTTVGNDCKVTITNGKFVNPFKVFSSNVTTILNSNNILIPVGRFKIEVYN